MTQYYMDTIYPLTDGGTPLANDLNNWKSAVQSNHRGSSRPSYVESGMIWVKTVSGTAEEVYYYDGADDVLLYTVNPTTNTVSYSVAASDVTNTPAGNITSTNQQAVNNELDTKKAAAVHTHAISDITDLQTTLDGGTSAGDLVKLDGSAKLPAVDGSQLTDLPSSGETLAIFNALKIAALEGDTTSLVGGIADPFYDETDVDAGITYGTGSGSVIGTNAASQGSTYPYAGMKFTATTTTTLTKASVNINTVSTAGNIHFELWADSGGSPGTQVGADSTTVAMATDELFSTFSAPPSITSGNDYWLICVRESGNIIHNTATRNTIPTELRTTLTSMNGSWNAIDAGENLMMDAYDASGASVNQTYDAAGDYYHNNAATPPNMTLQSNSFTADAAPDTTRLLWQIDPIDAITLNTDVIASVSRDGGTTWTTATLVEVETVNSSILLYEDASVDISGQPSGASMLWKLTTANNKEIRAHGVALQWS